MMKRLLVLSNNPTRASFAFRIQAHLDRLRERGIDSQVVRIPKRWSERFRLYRSAAHYDGVLLHKKKLSGLDAAVLRRVARRLIFDVDDAVMYSETTPDRFSPARWFPFHRSVRAADLVLAGNDYLAAHVEHRCDRVEVLPTGLRLRDYPVTQQRADGVVRLAWIGSRATLRYLRDLSDVLERIGRRHPDVVLRLICDCHFDLRHLPVEPVQWSAERQGTDLAEADIGLAPLPDNRFTRGKCGFKILQYMAAGLPVVASPVGVNADLVADGVNGYWATAPEQWLQRLTQLIEEPQVCRRMGQQSRRRVGPYDIEVIGTRFCDAVEAVLDGRV